jgi:hypothetical protein
MKSIQTTVTGSGQMELGFSPERTPCASANITRPPRNPQWWFSRMRQVVDQALDFRPAPMGRPEQIWLPQ